MKYILLVCWDTEEMDAQTEPKPTDARIEESFPGSMIFRRGASGARATSWLRRIASKHAVAQTGTIEVRPLWGT